MTEPTRGYIEAPHHTPSKAAWKEYSGWCRRHGAVRILVAKAAYWKVEIDARCTQSGRFDTDSRRWFTERATVFQARSESAHPRQRIRDARMTAYGLSHDDARQFAAEAVNRFPGLRGFTWTPATYARGVTYRLSDDPRPPNLKAAAHRLSDGKKNNLVSLAMKRKEKHPDDTDLFGMPKPRPRNPWQDGPA